jgi:hypothetical protein
MTFLLSGWLSLLFAIIVAVGWHIRRTRRGWDRRQQDYLWAFLHGGIIYVMAAIIIVHNVENTSFADILKKGFGETQVNIAFLGALFEAVWGLWEMWLGNSVRPSAHG